MLSELWRIFCGLIGLAEDRPTASLNPASTERDAPNVLTRYLFRRDFDRSSGAVKLEAFLPHKGETSVMDVTGLEESRIWALGREWVAPPRRREIHGRADFRRATFGQEALLTALSLIHTPPPPEHFAIRNWPDETVAPDAKERQMAMAQLLAKASSPAKQPSEPIPFR